MREEGCVAEGLVYASNEVLYQVQNVCYTYGCEQMRL
jgi:hypothetical protein